MASPKIGDVYLIRYAVAGPFVHHSRLIVLPHPHEANRAFVLTPDNDYYEEDLKPTRDVAAACHLPCFRAYPLHISAHEVYEFHRLPSQAIITRAYAAACHEYGVDVDPSYLLTPKLGLDVVAPVQIPPARAEGSDPPHTQRRERDGLRGLIDAMGSGVGDGRTLGRGSVTPRLDERTEDLQVGSKAPLPVTGDDLLTIAVGYDNQGNRHRHFKDAIDRMSEDEFPDFPIQGPRTLLWMLRWFADNGGSVEELGRSCQLLTYMVQYDQLNASNLAAGEAICRNITAVCMTHKDRFVSKVDNPELDIIDGRANAGSLLPLNPKLMEWLGNETRKTNLAQKELRKACEERALLKPKAKGKKE